MDMIAPTAILIVLATIIVDRTRAYRALPAAVNRLRRRRAADQSTTRQGR
jgi:hypothetical protein